MALLDEHSRCANCKFWKPTTFYDYEGAVNDGVCNEIILHLQIELKTGWEGGYVHAIETQDNFGCVAFASKK